MAFLMLGGKSHPASPRGLYWVRALADFLASRSDPALALRSAYAVMSRAAIVDFAGGRSPEVTPIVPRGLYWEWSCQRGFWPLHVYPSYAAVYWSDVVVPSSWGKTVQPLWTLLGATSM